VLLLKIYRPIDKFPNGGKMSCYLADLPLNSKINIIYPFGRFNYIGKSNTQIFDFEYFVYYQEDESLKQNIKIYAWLLEGQASLLFFKLFNTVQKNNRNPKDHNSICFFATVLKLIS
jgi:hypothetical protein